MAFDNVDYAIISCALDPSTEIFCRPRAVLVKEIEAVLSECQAYRCIPGWVLAPGSWEGPGVPERRRSPEPPGLASLLAAGSFRVSVLVSECFAET